MNKTQSQFVMIKNKTKPILPTLTLDTAYLDTSPTKKDSPRTTKSKANMTRKGTAKQFRVLMTEDDRIYKMSELENLKIERTRPETTIVGMRRVWDAYPSKKNLLQDVRRQYSGYLNSQKTPKLNNFLEKENAKNATEEEKEADNIIIEAGKIVKERSKHSTIVNTTLKTRSAIEFIDESKDISHKNYLINILKNERTALNEREKQITDSLKDCEKKLTSDELEFNDCKNKDIQERKNQEQALIDVLNSNKILNYEYKKYLENDKKYINEIHSTIKQIMNLKDYASFINQVIGGATSLPNHNASFFTYQFKEISDTANKRQEILEVADSMIKLYNPSVRMSELYMDNTEELQNKFLSLQEDIIKVLDKIGAEEKERKNNCDNYEAEIVDLKFKEGILKEERVKVLKEHEKLGKSVAVLNKKSRNELISTKITGFITMLKIECERNFFDQEMLSEKKKNEDQTNPIKNIIDLLKQLEMKVNYDLKVLDEKYTEKPELLKTIVAKRKLENKNKKLQKQKENEILINMEKKRKTEERMHKLIIKGRRVMTWKTIEKEKKKVEKTSEEHKEEEDRNFLMEPKADDY